MRDELKARVIEHTFGSQDAALDFLIAIQHSTTLAEAATKVRRETLVSIRDAHAPADSVARRLDPARAAEMLAVVTAEIDRRGSEDSPSSRQCTHDWTMHLLTAATQDQAFRGMMTATLQRMLAFLDHPRVAAFAEGLPLATDHHARVTAIRDELRRRGDLPAA